MKMKNTTSHFMMRMVFMAGVCGTLNAQPTCLEIGARPGAFSDQWYCVPSFPGPVGGTVNLSIDPLDFTASQEGRVDVVLPLDHGIVPDSSFV